MDGTKFVRMTVSERADFHDPSNDDAAEMAFQIFLFCYSHPDLIEPAVSCRIASCAGAVLPPGLEREAVVIIRVK